MMKITSAVKHYVKAVYCRVFHRSCSKPSKVSKSEPIFPIISLEQETLLSECIKITFTGDLLLLKNMVENGYKAVTKEYCFDSMFSYVKPYYDSEDYNIGVWQIW